MRVLHVAQPLDGGVPRIVADLVHDQVRRDWRVEVACPPASELVRLVAGSGAKVHNWDASRTPGPRVPLEARSIAKIIAAANPTLVHLHSAKAGLAGRLALRGRRATVFEPNAWSFEALSGALRSAAVRWERLAARWTDALVCVSRFEKESGVQVGISAPFEVVPNGIDLDVWGPAEPDDRAEARRNLGLPHDSRLVVCVGRLSRQKGQDVLLDAWPTVRAASEAELFLVGDGPDRSTLEARGVPGVTFLGTRRDVRGWFLATDVVVMPSRWEGMSLGMLEAMATGCSIVATDVAGAQEALGGGAGAVVPVENPDELASALIARLGDRDLAAREGRSARQRAQDSHDLKRATERIAAIYLDVVERRAQG